MIVTDILFLISLCCPILLVPLSNLIYVIEMSIRNQGTFVPTLTLDLESGSKVGGMEKRLDFNHHEALLWYISQQARTTENTAERKGHARRTRQRRRDLFESGVHARATQFQRSTK